MSHSITSQKYVPFYYWSKICPLYLVVEKMSVEKVSVEKMSRCPSKAVHFQVGCTVILPPFKVSEYSQILDGMVF